MNRTFKDVINSNLLFCGKIVILDEVSSNYYLYYRQVLEVK